MISLDFLRSQEGGGRGTGDGGRSLRSHALLLELPCLAAKLSLAQPAKLAAVPSLAKAKRRDRSAGALEPAREAPRNYDRES